MTESTGHIPTADLVPEKGRGTATLRCPECESDNICAQNKAFVTQKVSFPDDALTIIREPFGTDDVEFDGPEWYVCRDCGNHAEEIAPFVTRVEPPTDDEIRKLAQAKYGTDDVDIPLNAKVSRGPEPGAFVSAWVWVDFP
jgi:hypothetical protein